MTESISPNGTKHHGDKGLAEGSWKGMKKRLETDMFCEVLRGHVWSIIPVLLLVMIVTTSCASVVLPPQKGNYFVEGVEIFPNGLQVSIEYTNSSIYIARTSSSIQDRQLNLCFYPMWINPLTSPEDIQHEFRFRVDAGLYDRVAVKFRDGDELIWEANEEPNVVVKHFGREGVDELLAITGPIEGESLLQGADFSPETCFNVTPERVAEETDIRIFKFSETATSIALFADGRHGEICCSFGGWGFMDAVPWDYDHDGMTDLVILSSWGSGLHRAEVSVFNRRDMKSTVIYDTADEVNFLWDGDLCINEIVVEETPDGTEITAIRFSKATDVHDTGECMQYTVLGHHGSVVLENGQLVYHKEQ